MCAQRFRPPTSHAHVRSPPSGLSTSGRSGLVVSCSSVIGQGSRRVIRVYFSVSSSGWAGFVSYSVCIAFAVRALEGGSWEHLPVGQISVHNCHMAGCEASCANSWCRSGYPFLYELGSSSVRFGRGRVEWPHLVHRKGGPERGIARGSKNGAPE